MAAYVDLATLKLLGVLPPEDLDRLEGVRPGTIAAVANFVSRTIDARLAKRYATPFSPVPEAVRGVATKLVSCHLYLQRGPSPGTPLDDAMQRLGDEAEAWLKEAADSKDGLIDLPLRDDGPKDASAIDRGGPMMSTGALGPYSVLMPRGGCCGR